MLTLTAAQTYTGGTTIDAGSLVLGANAGLDATGAVDVNGGTLDLGDQDQTIGDLSGTGGVIALGTAMLTFGTADDTAFDGRFDGTGGLIQQGGGQITFGASLDLSGDITIDASAMAFTADTAGIASNIIDDGALVFSQGADSAFTGVIAGTGSMAQKGTGTLTLSGTDTVTGGITVSSGVLELTGDTALLGGNIADGTTLVFAQSADSSLGESFQALAA